VSWVEASIAGVTTATFTIDVTGTLQSPGNPSATAQFNLVTTLPTCTQSGETITIVAPSGASNQNYLYTDPGGSQTLALFTENSEVCDQLEITYVMTIASTVSGVNTDFVTTNFVDGAAFSGSDLVVSW